MPRWITVGEVFGLRGGRAAHSAALDDRAVEEALGAPREQETEDIPAARGLSEDGDIVRVATEGRDVLLHPIEGADGVEGAEVARALGGAAFPTAERGVPEPPEGPEAVVDRHHHDVVGGRQVAAVVEAGAADRVAATVDPEHDRESARAGDHIARLCPRRVDVEVEAVLVADDALRAARLACEGARELGTGVSRGQGLAHTVPARWRLRRPPAEGADRRIRVGNPAPDVAAVGPREADDVAGPEGAARRGIRTRRCGTAARGGHGRKREQR